MVSYTNPVNHAPRVQIGHVPRLISSHRLIQGKTSKIVFQTMTSTVYIITMQQCLVVSYIIPANQAPGVQTDHTPGGHLFI